MLIPIGNDLYVAGSFDVLCILHNAHTNRFHPAVFEERPFPGPAVAIEDLTVVRLKSKMHHTQGFETKEEALAELENMKSHMQISDNNVVREPILWNGEIGIVWLVTNWVTKNQTFQEAFRDQQ